MTSPELEIQEKSFLTNDLEGNYQIAICQDGKFAVTFDTANLRIKILENTDYRPFKLEGDSPQAPSESEIINKTIAHFKINDDLTVNKFYKLSNYVNPSSVDDDSSGPLSDDISKERRNNDKFRWSFDISNVQKRRCSGKYFILVAVSRMNVDEDMKKGDTKCSYTRGYLRKRKYRIENTTTIDVPKRSGSGTAQLYKGTAIYYFELAELMKQEIQESVNEKPEEVSNVVYFFRSASVSGICKFVNSDDEFNSNNILKRFIILNFHGIYNFKFSESNEKCNLFFAQESKINFKLNKKFEYPKNIRRGLDNWYTKDTKDDCVKRICSCIYDKYFIVTQYKDDIQSLEVYNLASMELETTAKTFDNDKLEEQYDCRMFSASKIQFCFIQGANHISLFYMENGLQVASREFNEIKKIYLLEFINSDEKLFIIGRDHEEKLKFIIWDLYHTDKIKLMTLSECSMEDIDARLATTSGNILHVDCKGNVTSVLKKITDELNLKEKEIKLDRDAKCIKRGNGEHNNESNERNNDEHKIYYDEYTTPNFDDDKDIISKFDKIANEREPWVLDDYERNSYCLYYNKEGTRLEFLQLIVGKSTVQVWHQIQDDGKERDQLPNKGEPFLEYVWTNGIPVDQERNETRLRIEYFKYGSSNGNDILKNKSNSFSLKVHWYLRKKREDGEIEIDKENNEIYEMEIGKDITASYVQKKTAIIKRRNIIEPFRSIRHACKALEHFNKRYVRKNLVDNYNKVHKYEIIVAYIQHIVWRFAKYNPEQFKLLDVRHNFMKKLILGDCDHLIRFILFGDEENFSFISSKEREKKEIDKRQKFRHVPTNILWPGEEFVKDDDLDFYIDDNIKDNELIKDNEIKPRNIMELVIYHCRGRELKDTIVIAYFLEYYSAHAIDRADWMSTVSTAIPLLFKYNYDDYVRKLFRKECFSNNDHFLAQDPDEIIPKRYLERRNHDVKFRAFRPIVKLKSDKYEWHDVIYKPFEDLKNVILKRIEDFDNDLGKSPLSLQVVPLPGFTISNIPKKKINYNFSKIILNSLLMIFVPRSYRIGRNERDKLDPFSKMILYENNDDIYDNPATEAVIDFHWHKARNFFLSLFVRFLIYSLCFGLVSWEYLNRKVDLDGRIMVILICAFYYLAAYQFVTIVLQLRYRGPKKFFKEVFSIIDIISLILSLTTMSIMDRKLNLLNGFADVETIDIGLIVGISFSICFLWIELIFYLRLLSSLGIYIYYFMIIFRTVFPFFLFILIVLFAFGHTMFTLLMNPDLIKTKDTTFTGVANSTNGTFNTTSKQDFDTTSSDDNPFSTFATALVTAYFWIDSDWVQMDEFSFWAVYVLTIVISIIVVIFLQNMLIAYMSNVFTDTETKSRQTLLRNRAHYIADYEALHHIHFWKVEPEPTYIYYFGQSKNFEDWDVRKGDRGVIYKDFEKKSTFVRRLFKDEDYDKVSILVYDDDIEIKIEKIRNMKSDIIDNIEDLVKKLESRKDFYEIKHINNLKNNVNSNIEYLIENLEFDGEKQF